MDKFYDLLERPSYNPTFPEDSGFSFLTSVDKEMPVNESGSVLTTKPAILSRTSPKSLDVTSILASSVLTDCTNLKIEKRKDTLAKSNPRSLI